MKLYATMTSDRGKPVSKSSNESIAITFTTDKRQKFYVVFNGEQLRVMSYHDASWHEIDYMKGNVEWCNQCQSFGCKQE